MRTQIPFKIRIIISLVISFIFFLISLFFYEISTIGALIGSFSYQIIDYYYIEYKNKQYAKRNQGTEINQEEI
jgi:hypothetical protein